MPNIDTSPLSVDSISVPYSRVSGLVRQLTHDVRNGLNTLDLQAAYVQELVTDHQASPELQRLRRIVSDTARMLQAFSGMFWLPAPHLVTYGASIVVEDFRHRLEKVLPETSTEIQWKAQLNGEQMAVDLDLLFRGLTEYFKNALQFRDGSSPIQAGVGIEKSQFVLTLVEYKTAVPSDPARWGFEPLVSTRRGGVGMGLFFARRVLAVHRGTGDAYFDAAAQQLVTRIALPLAG